MALNVSDFLLLFVLLFFLFLVVVQLLVPLSLTAFTTCLFFFGVETFVFIFFTLDLLLASCSFKLSSISEWDEGFPF